MIDALKLIQGDITGQAVDAIVNAANCELVGGGGVDGAIHRAGGPTIMAECDVIRGATGGCPTGTAVITTAGDLSAKAVIHTAGPRWHGGRSGERKLLQASYRSCLKLAEAHGLRTLAFPSISTGVYAYPIVEAAETALATVAESFSQNPGCFDEIRFVLFSESDFQVYRAARERLGI